MDSSREKHTISIECIGIRIQYSLRARELSAGRITISIILSSRTIRGRSMGHFMQSGGSLILSMAAPRQCWQIAVVQRAINNRIGGRESVGEHVGVTIAVDICAVVFRAPRGSRRALRCNGIQAGCDGGARR